jgi:ubiquinone/menaquinone biosynthesis C-methylase UbiE
VRRDLVQALREEMSAYFERRGDPLDAPAVRTTLDSNSTYVARRAEPLAAMLAGRGCALDGTELVDLGTGFGSMAVWFAGAGARVTAVDANAERFAVCGAVARRHGLALETVRSRLERLELPDERYDAAILSNVLCYLVDPGARAAALAETLRVLRPGGTLVVRDANGRYPVDPYARLAKRAGRERSRVRLISPAAARRELKEAGFQDVRGEPAGSLGARALAPLARYYHLTAVRSG